MPKQKSNKREPFSRLIRTKLEQALIDERVQRAFERDLDRELRHPGQLSLDSQLFPTFRPGVRS
jgi:hypothetical protein